MGCECLRRRKTDSLPSTNPPISTSTLTHSKKPDNKKTDDRHTEPIKEEDKRGKAREIEIDIERGDPAMEALQLKQEDRPCWDCLAGRCPDCNPPNALRVSEESTGTSRSLHSGGLSTSTGATTIIENAAFGSGHGHGRRHVVFSDEGMEMDVGESEDGKVERWLRGLPGRACPCKGLIEKMASRSMARDPALLETKTMTDERDEGDLGSVHIPGPSGVVAAS
ncbi:hypothetical protein QCA50_013800 [Cerrena zonata]|uniref:Uncharacterized protein n=1 Tax=Cerrena zonata TaxID=2478898 RepID=A0AAW0G0N7_9APHY